MIKGIKVENFKSLKMVNTELKNLNVLAGLNGMGKSSLIQVFLLLKQSLIIKSGKLEPKGALVSLGKGSDLLYQFASDDFFCFELNDDNDFCFNYKFPVNSEDTNFKPDSNKEFLPILERYFSNLQYISANRLGPQLMHEMSQTAINEENLGAFGEFTSHYLAINGYKKKISAHLCHESSKTEYLLDQVNAWLSEISPGVKVNISEISGADKMLLRYEFEMINGRTQPFKPENVGYGISYILSIIVALLISKQKQIVIIENPEAHIHPRGQAELGTLMAKAASYGAQLFIETHSDHIVNGIRVAVKEGQIFNKKVQFQWFKKITTENEQYTEIENVKLDKNGELDHYPIDFLDEWNNQLIKLV